MDVAEYGKDKSRIHALMWNGYTIEKKELIKRWFLVYITHQKGRNTFWTSVKDNIIGGNYKYKAIGLRDFD